MRKKWKNLLVVVCTASMLVSVQGASIKAEELQNDAISIADVVPEDNDLLVEDALICVDEASEDINAEEIIDEERLNDDETGNQALEEELVGAKSLQDNLDIGRISNNRLSLSFDREERFQEWIVLGNYGDAAIEGLKVTLKNAKHVQLDLSQVEELTNGISLGQYDDYSVYLSPDGRGTVSGTLSISATGYSTWNITLDGYSDYDTYHEFRMVKYVPSSYILKASSGEVTDIEGKLPQGVSYIPATKELYGAPMEKGNFVVNLVTSNGTREKATLYVQDNEDYYVANSVRGKYMGFHMPGAKEVGMNIFAFMSADSDQVFISNGEYSDFTKLWMNGKTLTKGTDYSVASDNGKTKITLKSSVLKNRTNKISQEDINKFDGGEDEAFFAKAHMYANTICAEFNTNPSETSRGAYMKTTPYNFYVVGETSPIVTPTPKVTSLGFSDVQNPKHAYYNAIYWAAKAGITKGYSDGTFGINKNCTRGEMMMFLWRYAGKKEPKAVSKSPFKDVPKTHAFYKAILWGSQKGITKGYSDGTFGINRNVSRGECMMFLWRLKGKPAPKAVAKAPFPDVPKSHVFYNAVLWGYQKKITTGFTDGKLKGKFGVNENCTRGQIVTFLYRAK